jgi:hypothetical protein
MVLRLDWDSPISLECPTGWIASVSDVSLNGKYACGDIRPKPHLLYAEVEGAFWELDMTNKRSTLHRIATVGTTKTVIMHGLTDTGLASGTAGTYPRRVGLVFDLKTKKTIQLGGKGDCMASDITPAGDVIGGIEFTPTVGNPRTGVIWLVSDYANPHALTELIANRKGAGVVSPEIKLSFGFRINSLGDILADGDGYAYYKMKVGP